MTKEEVCKDIMTLYSRYFKRLETLDKSNPNAFMEAPGLLELVWKIDGRCKEYLKVVCNKITIRFSGASQYSMERDPKCKCPHNLKGVKCCECGNFVVFCPHAFLDSYTVFAGKPYDAYCTKDNNYTERIIDMPINPLPFQGGE